MKLRTQHAVLIGVTKYADNSWGPLKGASKDLARIASLLKRRGFAVTQLTSPQQTTRTALLSEVRKLCHRAERGGTLYVHFSGHGMSADGIQWLVPSDAPGILGERARGPLAAIASDFLVPADFRGALAQSEADITVFVIDACRTPLDRSDRRTGSVFIGVPARPDSQVVFVYAAAPEAPAYETEDGGLLTSALAGAFEELPTSASLSTILALADRRLAEAFRSRSPGASLLASPRVRIQTEDTPGLGHRQIRLFAPRGRSAMRRPSPLRARSLPSFDINAFRAMTPTAQRGETLRCFSHMHAAIIGALAPSETAVPGKTDSKIIDDDPGFLDFNFWSPNGPINAYGDGAVYFWFFLSMNVKEINRPEAPDKSLLPLHFGAILTRTGAAALAAAAGVGPRRFDDLPKALVDAKRSQRWKKVAINRWGNLQFDAGTFAADHRGIASAARALRDFIAEAEPVLVAAARAMQART